MSEDPNQNNYPETTPPLENEKSSSVYPPVSDGPPNSVYPPVSDGPPNSVYPPVSGGPPNSVYPPVSDGLPNPSHPPLQNGQPYPGYGYPPQPNGQPYPGYGYPPQPNGQPYPGYGYPPFPNGQPYPGYGFDGPPRQPLPLGKALKQLPKQYLRVLTKPSVATFAEEKQKAAWNIIWVQMAFIAIIGALISFATYSFVLPTLFSLLNLPKTGGVNIVDLYKSTALQTSLVSLISTPVSLFISLTIYHFIAKAFKGRGAFVEYVYSYLLFLVPIEILRGLLLLIPFGGLFLAFVLDIYTYVLMIFMTMAVHRLGGGKASLAVLILPIIGIILLIIVIIMLFALFGAIISGAHPQ